MSNNCIVKDAKNLGVEIRISQDPNGFCRIYFKNDEEMHLYKLAGKYKEDLPYCRFIAGFVPRLKDGSYNGK